jgi:hypothetical protein
MSQVGLSGRYLLDEAAWFTGIIGISFFQVAEGFEGFADKPGQKTNCRDRLRDGSGGL